MANTIQIKRGNKADLPILKVGEFGFCLDTKEFYIGTGTLNIQLNLDSRVNDLITKVNTMPTVSSVDSKINTLKVQLTNLIEALKEDNDEIIDRVDEVENSISDILDDTSAITNKLNNHTHAIADTTGSLDASRIAGVIDMSNLPKGSIETIVVVANKAERLALTKDRVQNGDTVKENDIGQLFVVVDDTKLGEEAGYMDYTAGIATSAPWAGITGKPTDFIYGDESQLTTVSKRIVPATNELKTLFDTSVSTINTDITTLKANVNTINTTLTTNNSKIEGLESDVMGSTTLGSATYLKANLDSHFDTSTNIVNVPPIAGYRVIRSNKSFDVVSSKLYCIKLKDSLENQKIKTIPNENNSFENPVVQFNLSAPPSMDPAGYLFVRHDSTSIYVFIVPTLDSITGARVSVAFRDKNFTVDVTGATYSETDITIPEYLAPSKAHTLLPEGTLPNFSNTVEIGAFEVIKQGELHTPSYYLAGQIYDESRHLIYVDESATKNQLRSATFKVDKEIEFLPNSKYVVKADIEEVNYSDMALEMQSEDGLKDIVYDGYNNASGEWEFHSSIHQSLIPAITFKCQDKDFKITNIKIGEQTKLKNMVSVFEAKIKEFETRIHALETKTP